MEGRQKKPLVLITGCRGFIGRRLGPYLQRQGYQVLGLDRQPVAADAEPSLSRYYAADLAHLDPSTLLRSEAILAEVGLIVHCAAQQPRPDLPLAAYLEANVLGLDQVLKLASKVGCKKLIALSTAASFAFPLEQPEAVTETSPVHPQNDYGLSKYFAEQVLRLRAEQEGLNVVCLKLPSVFVEEQPGGLVHTYAAAALAHRDVELFSQGRYRRSLIYMDEVLQGIGQACSSVAELPGYHDFILATRDAWSMREIAAYIYTKLESRGRILPVEREAPVRGHWVLDCSKAERLLGFQAATTEAGLAAYLARLATDPHIRG